jgi:hypothetical protein
MLNICRRTRIAVYQNGDCFYLIFTVAPKEGGGGGNILGFKTKKKRAKRKRKDFLEINESH